MADLFIACATKLKFEIATVLPNEKTELNENSSCEMLIARGINLWCRRRDSNPHAVAGTWT